MFFVGVFAFGIVFLPITILDGWIDLFRDALACQTADDCARD
jgi:hypothetical protein